MPVSPTVILDDATPGHERLTRFVGALGVIQAGQPGDVPGALAAIRAALAAGRHVAGYLSYEMGYLLEPRLAPLLPPARTLPLLWFGVFEGIEEGPWDEILGDETVPSRAYAGPLKHGWDQTEYAEHFTAVREFIAAGNIYQANLSFRSRFAFTGDALALYRRLRERSAAPYGAFIDDGERRILSFSPELFFDLSADGRLTARPMKGTIARGNDETADALAKAELAASAKDRAENLMIVDLLRNDLGRIARIGSVGVEKLFAVETYPTLHTMVSTVTATLTPGTGVEAILRALFPCGSVTGAPKIRAMEIIQALEADSRGLYCGAIGHFSPPTSNGGGSARFNVAIRTLTIKDGCGELGIGGAVVQDSSSGGEYDECLLKARYFEIARKPIELIETLTFDPRKGFVRLGLHLDRMENSAAALGIAFGRDAARSALESAAYLATGPLRVRLTLNESGAFDCTAAHHPGRVMAWTYAISPLRIGSADALARHKTNWREHLDDEFARLAKTVDCDEAIFLNERGEVAEGSRTNVFLSRAGRLITPPLSAGILDGCLRRELLNEGKCVEETLFPGDLAKGEVFLGNSLRGLVRAIPV